MEFNNGNATQSTSFTHTRLRRYAGMVESVIDPQLVVANTMALTAQEVASSLSSPDVRASMRPGTRDKRGPRGASAPSKVHHRSYTLGPDSLSEAGAAPETMQAALAEVATLKSEVAGMETVLSYLKGSDVTTVMGRKAAPIPTQEQLRAKMAAQWAAGAMISPPGSSHGNRGQAAKGGRYEELTKSAPSSARQWRPPTAPTPVGRGEAVILQAALEEALPAGAISAKYSPNNLAASALSGAAGMFLASQDVRHDLALLEAVLRETARQVAFACSERGKLLVTIAERYNEIVAGALTAAKASSEDRLELVMSVKSAEKKAADYGEKLARVEAELAIRTAHLELANDRVTRLETDQEHQDHDSEEVITALKRQNEILAAETQAAFEALETSRVSHEAMLETGLQELSDNLEQVVDERDNLLGRMRFMEAQLVKLRESSKKKTRMSHVACQTEPVIFGAMMPVAEVVEEEVVQDAPMPSPKSPTLRKVKEKEKRASKLGIFQGLIQLQKLGRVRGRSWLLNVLGAMYYDKVINDATADREGNPHLSLADFALEWHLTKFGIRRMAETSLLDVIASTRAHYKSSQRIRWFATFTCLTTHASREVHTKEDTIHQVGFYLFILQQLAYPNAITSLFPENDEPVGIKAAAVPEAVRAIFRYLNDVDASAIFMSRVIEPMLSVSGSTSLSEALDVDRLVNVLMAEYNRRQTKSVAHLKALFRAVDLDGDGQVTYDEFVTLMRHIDPTVSDRRVGRAYSEAIARINTIFTSLVNVDIFVTVMHMFGYDRWRIDPTSPLPGVDQSRGPSLSGRPNSGRPDSAPHHRSLLRILDGALESLYPSLEDQVQAVVEAAPTPLQPQVTLLLERQRHFQKMYSERTDVEGTWLAFRVLLASLVSFTSGRVSTSPLRNVDNTRKVIVVPNSGWKVGTASQSLDDGSYMGSSPEGANSAATSRNGSPARGSSSAMGEMGIYTRPGSASRSQLSVVLLETQGSGSQPLTSPGAAAAAVAALSGMPVLGVPAPRPMTAQNSSYLSSPRDNLQGDGPDGPWSSSSRALSTSSPGSFKFSNSTPPLKVRAAITYTSPQSPRDMTTETTIYPTTSRPAPFRPRSEVRFVGVLSGSQNENQKQEITQPGPSAGFDSRQASRLTRGFGQEASVEMSPVSRPPLSPFPTIEATGWLPQEESSSSTLRDQSPLKRAVSFKVPN